MLNRRYLLDPRLTRAATSATRLPNSRASAISFASIPGDSEPVVALAPNRPNGPPALMTIISEPSIAPRIVSIVTSLPLAPEPPVANAAPTLLRIFRDLASRPNLGPQLSRNVLTCPEMLPTYTGEPTMTASADKRSSRITSPTRFRTTLVPETALTPSATPWAIFSVLPVAEWYVTSTITGAGSAASPGLA